MRRHKRMQYLLISTAAAATVLCASSSLHPAHTVSGLLYGLFVLCPLLAATLLQLGSVKQNAVRLHSYIYIYIIGYIQSTEEQKSISAFRSSSTMTYIRSQA